MRQIEYKNIVNNVKLFLLFSKNRLLSYLLLISKVANVFALLLSILVLLTFVYEIGFNYDEAMKLAIHDFYIIALRYFPIVFILKLISDLLSKGKYKIQKPYLIVFALLIAANIPFNTPPNVDISQHTILRLLSTRGYYSFVLILVSFLNISTSLTGLLGRKTSPPLVLAISFAVIIIIGTGLLLLPNSSVSEISLIDSFFIATSAVCVTGLSPVEISEVFTPMGQGIILLLIQIGGLGVMTLTSFFTLFFMGNTSVYNQIAVSDMISSNSISSLLSTLVRILGLTFLIEAISFIFILITIHGTLDMTLNQEINFAIFHAISSFCNAGFSTLTGNFTNPIVNGNSLFFTVISFTIILGGIGFPIISNFSKATWNKVINICNTIRNQRNKKRRMYIYHINTKLVLYTTLLLLIFSTTLIAAFEWNNAFNGLPFSEKISQSFFAAVSPRTAGFNTLDMTGMSIQTTILTLLLMWIGGGSQSTAGGIKVNTFAVAVASSISHAIGKDKVELMGRRISDSSINRSYATIFISLIILFTAIMTLSIIEPHISLMNIIYECISAISTVGLSLNTTPTLSTNGKLIIISLMYIGRIGILTLMLAIIRQPKNTKYNYPCDDIIIT